MITAMPEVKPTITGFGMNLMTPPSCATPIASRMHPAMSVATCRPSMPYCAVIPASTAMKAPVGPEICTRVPPRSEVASPATIAVYRPCSGFAPEAMANAIASGSATMPTITPATTLGQSWARLKRPARWASRKAIIRIGCTDRALTFGRRGLSLEVGDAAQLDALARPRVGKAVVAKRRVRHAQRPAAIAVVELEQHDFIARHVREVPPAMIRVVAE